MAGSYQHILDGWSLIENMGDAYETIEELLWLVQKEIGTKKALKLLEKKFYPMQRGEIKKDKALLAVETILNK